MDHLGRFADGERAFEESLALRRKTLGDAHWLVGSSLGVLGDHYTQTHEYAKAEKLLLDADRRLSAAVGADNVRTLTNVKRLVTLYQAMGLPEKAAQYQARAAAAQAKKS